MITVVIPAYNEEDSIADTVRRVRHVLNSRGLFTADVIVVDDGSADKTLRNALEAGALVARHPHNLGYGRALKTGIAKSAHDAIAIIDADMTYPVESLPELIDKYNEGFDMVVGARTGEYYRESVVKERLRAILKRLVEFTAGRGIPDINSGMRIFSRAAAMKHFDHLCDTFSFTTSITLAYMMTGRTVSYMPINYERRQGKTKVKLFRDSLRTLQYIVQAIVFFNPLKLFVLVSAACALAALPLLAIGLVASSMFFTVTGSAFLVMAGFAFFFGLVADLMRQIGLRLQGNTNYISQHQPVRAGQEAISMEPPQQHPTQRNQTVTQQYVMPKAGQIPVEFADHVSR